MSKNPKNIKKPVPVKKNLDTTPIEHYNYIQEGKYLFSLS